MDLIELKFLSEDENGWEYRTSDLDDIGSGGGPMRVFGRGLREEYKLSEGESGDRWGNVATLISELWDDDDPLRGVNEKCDDGSDE